MSTFLYLVQRTCSECGIPVIPSTVVGQVGQQYEAVNWVNSAWMDIQNQHRDWKWLRASVSFPSVAAQATYTPAQAGATNLGSWCRDTFRSYLTATGTNSEVFLTWMDYEAWRNVYQFSANRNAFSQPYDFTITPAKALGFGPVTAAGYTITGDYYAYPTELSVDGDIPAMPSQFHMAIVYMAMMSYGVRYEDQGTYKRGEREFKRLMEGLETDQGPTLIFGNC